LRILRQPALALAPRTAEGGHPRIRALAERSKLVNRQIRDAQRRLDGLCTTLAGDDGENETEQRDVTILRSLPGVGRIVLATLLPTSQAHRLKAHESAEPLRPAEASKREPAG
jgi:hypothetical protein